MTPLSSHTLFLILGLMAACRKSGCAYEDVTECRGKSFVIRIASLLVFNRCKICRLLHKDTAVSPFSVRTFLSAPFFNNKAATSKYPLLHAQCRAVLEKYKLTKNQSNSFENISANEFIGHFCNVIFYREKYIQLYTYIA